MEFICQYEDICDFEMSAWNDDLDQKIMGIDVTSKSNPEHTFRLSRAPGTPIGENHFGLSRIGGFDIFCLAIDRPGHRTVFDIGRNGLARNELPVEIESLVSVVDNYDEILKKVEELAMSEKDSIIQRPSGRRVRFYVRRCKSEN